VLWLPAPAVTVQLHTHNKAHAAHDAHDAPHSFSHASRTSCTTDGKLRAQMLRAPSVALVSLFWRFIRVAPDP
jgi:hypothetical protein